MTYQTGLMADGHPLKGRPCEHVGTCAIDGLSSQCGVPSVFKAYNTEAYGGFTYCSAHIEPRQDEPFLCGDCR